MTDLGTLADCIRQIVETTREQQRGEADLAAQRDMAKWAWAVVLISTASVVVGAIGIVFIKRTYDKTAEAVETAQSGNRQSARAAVAAQNTVDAALEANRLSERAMAMQQRPWVKLSVQAISLIDLRFDSAGARVTVENVGATPALNVRVVAFPCIVRAIRPDKSHVARFVERAFRTAPDNTSASVVAFPGDPFDTNVPHYHFEELDLPNQFNKGRVGVLIVYVCTYQSSVVDIYYHTCAAVEVRQRTETGTSLFDIDGPPVGVENLVFEVDNRLTSVS